MFTFVGVLVVLGAMLLFASVKVLPEYQRGVVLTVGRYTGTKGPGLVLLIPVVQRMIRVDLRITVMDVPPQDVISRDNVSVRVNAVVYFRVVQPDKSVLQVVNFLQATSQLAQTRLRSVLGQHELDEILSQRESINRTLQTILDEATDPWGIKVANVEIKDVDLNETMVRAIARQAEAERERRAKVIHAEGEMQAAEKPSDSCLTGQTLSVKQDVDHARVRTAGDDHQAAVAHVEDECLVVPDHRIGPPTISLACLVDRKATLELGDPLDLSGDQNRAVEQQAVRALLDHLNALGLKIVTAGRRQSQLTARGKRDSPLTPSVGVDHQRQPRAATTADQPLQAAVMVHHYRDMVTLLAPLPPPAIQRLVMPALARAGERRGYRAGNIGRTGR